MTVNTYWPNNSGQQLQDAEVPIYILSTAAATTSIFIELEMKNDRQLQILHAEFGVSYLIHALRCFFGANYFCYIVLECDSTDRSMTPSE